MGSVTNINEVLDGHVALEVSCIDRLYLNAHVPNLQVGGQVVSFLHAHLGNPIPSPAIFEKIGNKFRRDVDRFVLDNDIPVLRLKKPDRSRWDDRKIDHVKPYVDKAIAKGRFGVIAVVAAQEFQCTSTSSTRTSVWASSRSAPTSLTRPRSGSTGTSGRSGKPTRPASATRRWPTGSPHAKTRPPSRRSARR